MADVDVSVIVPCYNVERYLDQALTSIEGNDRCQLEIICVNDGSTDGSLEIMRAHANVDGRYVVIDKENSGYGANVNLGFRRARGRYVAILEPDDYAAPHMYDELFARAGAWGFPDVVKSAYWDVIHAGTEREVIRPCSYHDCIFPPHQPFRLVDVPRLIAQHPSIWSALYRRDFLHDQGVRFMEVPGAGWVDNPFMIESLCKARSIAYVNECYYHYRKDLPGSSSDFKLSRLPFERWNDMADLLEAMDVADEGIWSALYVRAFSFVDEAVCAGALEDDEYRAMILALFKRMDARPLMDGLPVVPPESKSLYYEMLGKPVPRTLAATYRKAKLRDFLMTLRFYGPAAFARRVEGVLRRAGDADGC